MSATRSITTVVQNVLDGMLSGDFSGYEALDRKERIALRKAIRTGIDQCVRNGDLSTGQSLLAVQSQLSEMTGKSGSGASTLSPEEQIGQRVSNLLEAARKLAYGEIAPEGMNPVDLRNYGFRSMAHSSDENGLPAPNAESVQKVATARIGRKTKQNDIPSLIRSVFANVPTGTFMKVSDIRRAIATDRPELGVSAEWDGRLSAALFGKNGVEGVEPVNSDHPRYSDFMRNGGIKVESDSWDELEESGETDESD